MAQNNPNLKWTRLAAAVALGLCTGLATIAYSPSAAAQTAEAKRYDLKAGTLDEALSQFGLQSGLQILAPPELVAGHRAQAVSGDLTSTQVLERLLRGTGLSYERINASTIVIRRTDAPAAPPQAGTRGAPATATRPPAEPEDVQELDKLVVTGTRLRGVQPSSPLLTITSEEMRLSGHSNLGDVARAIPQNFAGGQNPSVLNGSGGSISNQNITGASSLNLRGLGPDATVTLLNGQRLPYDGFSQATDVAVIPAAAIDRFEVLLDGASAIYGSDAVGGVANIILRRDYDGGEVSARYGEASDGGYGRTQVSTVVGTTWATGGLLVAGETTSTGTVRASQRDFSRDIPHSQHLRLHPTISQDGILISGHQKLGTRSVFGVDAFYTQRAMTQESICSATLRCGGTVDTEIHGVAPSLQIGLANDWTLRASAFSGRDEAGTANGAYSLATGLQTSSTGTKYRNSTDAMTVDFEGPAFRLPAGVARLSLGAGWRKAEYEQGNRITGATTLAGSNTNRHASGEINVPIVSEAQGIWLVNRFSANAAIRHDDYDSFGSSTNPKVGVVWQLVPSLDLRATWGRSFKAPRLSEQYQASGVQLRTAASLGIVGVPNTATVFTTSGGNPDLEPERAKVVTAGLTFRPAFLDGTTVELGWFSIDYRQRVVAPFPTAAVFPQSLNDPVYARFITRNPTAQEQQALIDSALTFSNQTNAPYDPDNVIFVFQNHRVNASSQHVEGIDLDVRHTIDTAGGGLWSFNAGGSWITDSTLQLIEGLAGRDTAGVVFYPASFKGRASASWSRSNFSLTAIAYHVGGVRNTEVLPSREGGSTTTFDLVFDYAADVESLGGFGFNLSVSNIFNRAPPFMQSALPYYVNWDSTNYSGLGRVVSIGITKRF